MCKLLGTYQEEWEKQKINYDLYIFQLWVSMLLPRMRSASGVKWSVVVSTYIYMFVEILDLLNEESVSGACSGRASL